MKRLGHAAAHFGHIRLPSPFWRERKRRELAGA